MRRNGINWRRYIAVDPPPPFPSTVHVGARLSVSFKAHSLLLSLSLSLFLSIHRVLFCSPSFSFLLFHSLAPPPVSLLIFSLFLFVISQTDDRRRGKPSGCSSSGNASTGALRPTTRNEIEIRYRFYESAHPHPCPVKSSIPLV